MYYLGCKDFPHFKNLVYDTLISRDLKLYFIKTFELFCKYKKGHFLLCSLLDVCIYLFLHLILGLNWVHVCR